MAKSNKNVALAQIVKGVNKNKKVYYQLLISVVVQDKGIIIPFKSYYLNEFESYMIQDLVGVSNEKQASNDKIIAILKKGISSKNNKVYYLFDISLDIDSEVVKFKQVLLSDFERISLVKRCGFDTTDIESVEYVEDEETRE